MSESGYMTVLEVAELARCEHKVVRRAVEALDIRAIRGCASWLITEADARDWIEAVPAEAEITNPDADYARVIRRDPCCYCGAPTEHVDHIHPRVRGGQHAWTNITAACQHCNSQKHARSLLAFLLSRVTP